MQKMVTIADDLPDDVRLLCLRALEGDQSAVNPLLDCLMENAQNKQRIAPNYVITLEDQLREAGQLLRRHTMQTMGKPDNGWAAVPPAELATFNSGYFKLVQFAASLGRTGHL